MTARLMSALVSAQVLEALQQGASHDALVCCAGYVLGEYGRLVPEVPTHVQFALLHERFLTVSNETKVRTFQPHGSPNPPIRRELLV